MISNEVLTRFPRSAKYDLRMLMSSEMGPNAMWLTEFLTQEMNLKPEMKVLDLGCGKAMSSIFIAREFGVKVWATDLWIAPTENYQTIKNFNLEDSVFPIYSEAHSLPYAEDFFDAIICVDAYHYFGTDDLYLPYLLKYLKDRGEFGIVVPGFVKEIDSEIRERFKDYWDNELYSLKPLSWWDNHLRKMEMLDITHSDNLPDAFQFWYEWEKYLDETGMTNPIKGSDLPFLEADKGDFACFNRITGRKK